MGWVPIVIRELIVASRKGAIFRFRFRMALLATLFLFFTFPSLLRGGTVYFKWMGQIGFWLCVFAGATLTAGAVSQERREGTLPILFLSNLTGWDVVIGKLASGSLQAFMNLTAVFPILAVALIFGGVTLSQVVTEIGVWVAALLFSLTTGLWISCWRHWEKKRGEGIFTAAFVFLFGVPWGMIFFQNATLLSLGDVQWALLRQLGAGSGFSGSLRDIWKGIFWITGGALGMLMLAGFHLQRNWRKEQEETQPKTQTIHHPTSSTHNPRKSPGDFRSPYLWLEQCFSFSSVSIRVVILLTSLLLGAWTVLVQIPRIQMSIQMQNSPSYELAMFFTLFGAGFGIRLLMLFIAPMGIKGLMRTGLLQLLSVVPGGLMEWWKGRNRAFRRFYSRAIVPILLCAGLAWISYTERFSVPLSANLRIGGYILVWTIALIYDLDAIHAIRVVDTLQGKRASILHTFGSVLGVPWVLKIFILPLFIVPPLGFFVSGILHIGNAMFWKNTIYRLEEDSIRFRLLARA